jgi:hypothetical protein
MSGTMWQGFHGNQWFSVNIQRVKLSITLWCISKRQSGTLLRMSFYCAKIRSAHMPVKMPMIACSPAHLDV